MTELNQIETPALLLDSRRMMRNIRALESRLKTLGTVIRPHVKTCKSIEIGRRMITGGSPGITVSTLAEAEAFFRHGIDDQIYAVGIAPGKLARVAGLMGQGLRLKIILDNAETAARVVDAAKRLGCRYSVLLEIDSDGQRAGFEVGDPELVGAAQTLDQGGCEVAGVITHMGAAYACRDAGALI
ncbi:MAG: alanine racemase, partial [Xanthomonadaceae bacterium]|nr:alanine racemase [Xanthomonadaceae bacterium]